MIGLTGIPNARLAADIEAINLLKSSEGPSTVGEVRTLLRLSPADGVEPEDLFELANELNYAVEVKAIRCCHRRMFRRPAPMQVRSDRRLLVTAFPGSPVKPGASPLGNLRQQSSAAED